MKGLLIAPFGHGGEGVYRDTLLRYPPDGWTYSASGDFHEGGPDVRCRVAAEVALNRLVHPHGIPDMGFRALALRTPVDLIHIHAHRVSLRRARGIPLVMSEGSSVVVFVRDYLGWDEDRLRLRLSRSRRLYRALGIADRLLAMERASAVYVFSHWARELNVRWGADPAKLRVIWPGFSTPPLPERSESDERCTFLFVGGDFERKGGVVLVEAFAQVAEELPGAHLIVAGSDPAARNPDRLIHTWISDERRVAALATLAELERRGRATVRRGVPRDELYGTLFPAADSVVLPTHAEGFGFTNVEALSFGLPVVTTRVGPAEEIVEDGVSGMLVAPGDVGALADALRTIGSNPDRRRSMGAAARDRFLERFTLDRMRSEIGALYAETLK